MQEYDPGTIIELYTLPYYDWGNQLHPGKRTFHRMFWTFGPWIRVFPCIRVFFPCKPFVQVDET